MEGGGGKMLGIRGDKMRGRGEGGRSKKTSGEGG